MGILIPMDQHAAAEEEKRALADAERARRYAIKTQIKTKTLDLKRHQQKLREITEVNATMLSANGDLLIRQAMQKLADEIEGLKKDLEGQ